MWCCKSINNNEIPNILKAPRAGAHEAPGPRSPARSPVRRSARAAVRGPGAVQFVLGEQGRRSSGPCGTRCPALALAAPSTPTGRSAARPAFFSLQTIFFQSRNKHQNRSEFARSYYYLAPAVRCGEEVCLWPWVCFKHYFLSNVSIKLRCFDFSRYNLRFRLLLRWT